MRKYILLHITLLLAILSFAPLRAETKHSFANNSVLSSGKWMKIKVNESGICRITYDQLKQWGFNSPANVRVFGYGGAVLSEDFSNDKVDDLCEVPLYDNGNYFLFYAQGPTQWVYKKNGGAYAYDISVNPYSFCGYYFLTENVGSQKRITYEDEIETDVTSVVDLHTYYNHQKYKKEEFNYISSGKTWFGDKMGMNGTKTVTFKFPGIDKRENVYIHTVTAAYSLGSTADLRIFLGDTILSKEIKYSYCGGHVEANVQNTYLSNPSSSETIKATITYNGNNSSYHHAIERITAFAYCDLSMGNQRTLFFRNDRSNNRFNKYNFHVSGCNENVQIWNITEHYNPRRVATQRDGSELSFLNYAPEMPQEFVAVDVKNPEFITADKVEEIENQNLHAERDLDLVIITHPDLWQGAERIAKLHEEYDDMNVLITTQEKVFNEFSSGTPDPTAIRWFMKMLYERNGQKPFYLLLLGDGTFDNRGILTTKSKNKLLITYQGGSSTDESCSYTTDDYFTFLDDDEITGKAGNAKMDINVGRIPANSLSELNGVIDKIEKHIQNKSYGKWKNKVILLADDNEESSAYQKFCEYSDNLAKKAHQYNPAIEVKKVYLDAYTRTTGANGSRYYEVEDLLKEEIGNGILFLNYVGHSSITGFTAEHVFTQSQAKSIYNENCGFWFTASCQFSQYDGPNQSGGEDLLLNPNGGAIGLVSSARVVFDNRNDNLNQALFTHLFDRDSTGMPLRIGDVVRLSKQGLPNDSNKLAFIYMGDPAIRLHYPSGYVETDSIQLLNGEYQDTISALSEVRIFGHISDKDSMFTKDFNGTIFATVYDKEMTLYTKANIYSDEEDIIKNRHTYTDRPNVLFSGQVEVTNGRFNITFKIPKDINYSYGDGRITYYAYDEENGYEAQGAYENFTIGGSCDNESEDTSGPNVALFMNYRNFKSGEKVNSSPVFYAHVSDENGINASGSGIGHDITLTREGSNVPINLNNYFSYSKDSYRDGSVAYQFTDLEDGTYTFTFKVWDLLNNSSTQSISFTVDHKLNVEVEELTVYPNPVKEKLTIRMTHSQPKTVQTFRFLLYDVSGTLVYQSDNLTNKNDGTVVWTWDLTTQNGRRVDPGCYIGRTEIQVDDKKFTGESKKIIVLPQ